MCSQSRSRRGRTLTVSPAVGSVVAYTAIYGQPMSKVVPLRDAVARHIRAGDAIHVVCGHTRWTAAPNEVVRQWWGRDAGFELSMLSLSTLGTLWFRGGLVSRVITGYSGDVFPNFTPNRI